MNVLPRIGDVLVEQGWLSPEALEEGLEAQAENGERLGQVLVQQKKITEQELLNALALQLDLEVMESIDDKELRFDLVEQLPIQYLKKHEIFPFQSEDGTLRIAVNDPLDLEVLDDLRILFGQNEIRPVLVPAREILSAINRTYGQANDTAEQLMQDLGEEADSQHLFTELEVGEDLLDETSEAPIIKLVNHIFSQAVKSQASDIHIEPYQKHLQVRFRLDGVLHNVLSPPRRLHAAIVSRIKVMARLDIAEKRLPQDGRTEVKIGERLVDVRVSCLPTAFGERVVLRLLEKSGKLLSMEEIGLTAAALAEMKRLLHLSHGIILVTGPTGSGKTTTLYAALSSINSPDKNILTIEDPIEYQLDGIGQMQVNPKINLTFASGLRSMVRQDPDVILVGEIRDRETADIAIHAALTGHLVFSTLHTNDSASAVTRLTDMGIEPFLVSTAVQAIIAQRLVRLLCPHCKEAYEPEEAQWAELRSSREVAGPIFRADGCEKCLETGYRGRTGIYEFLLLSEAIKGLVLKTSDANQINKVARAEGMANLREDGINKVTEGRTTISEVLRVTQI
ncbi:MAG: type II secretion system ATPase GspE [Deltaproteobacteria bacterium]|nr:type II secretion system ATPase GspE [Deltaproteobacteria bacterium]PNV82922.1 MAG: type II secretion system protein GspE [Desulfobacteraceae bacterium]